MIIRLKNAFSIFFPAANYDFFENSVFSGFCKSIFLHLLTGGAANPTHNRCKGCFTFTNLFLVAKIEVFDDQWRVGCEKKTIFGF